MKFQTRRGISPIIATLLLIAIAVAASIVVYVFVTGLAGNLTTGGGQQTTERLQMQSYNFSPRETSKRDWRNVRFRGDGRQIWLVAACSSPFSRTTHRQCTWCFFIRRHGTLIFERSVRPRVEGAEEDDHDLSGREVLQETVPPEEASQIA